MLQLASILCAQQRSVLHSGDMPQKHLNDFWGYACSLLIELFNFCCCLFLKTFNICTRVTAALETTNT